MWAFSADNVEADFQYGQIPKEWFFVLLNQGFHPFGGCGQRRIVDFFRRSKLIANGLKLRCKRGPGNSFGESPAIAEEKALELVHHHKREETCRIETTSHFPANIYSEGIFDQRCFLGEGSVTGFGTARPGLIPGLRQSIIINHCCRQAGGVFSEVLDYIIANRAPCPDAATTVALASIPHDAGVDQRVSPAIKMWRENFIHKIFLGFPLHVNKNPCHVIIPCPGARPARSFPIADRGCNLQAKLRA